MYATLSRRNAKISIRNYAIYFITLVLAIGLFYVFLALPQQDVIRFLHRYEGRAVMTLLKTLKYLAVFVLLGLFFLIRYANSFMLERRRREIGMYLILGMHQSKVFRILFLESVILGAGAWVIGIALGVILSELLSLFAIRAFELDILTHYFKISWEAVWQTAVAFFVLQIAVNLFQSTKVFRLTPEQWLIGKDSRGEQKNKTLRKLENLGTKGKGWLLPVSLVLIGAGYFLGLSFANLFAEPSSFVDGMKALTLLLIALILGSVGTVLLFYSLGHFLSNMNRLAPRWYYKRLHAFSTREFTRQLGMRSVSVGLVCLLLFLSIVLFSFGIIMAKGTRGAVAAMTSENGRPIDMTAFGGSASEHIPEFVSELKAADLVGEAYDVHTATIMTRDVGRGEEAPPDLDPDYRVVPVDLDDMFSTVREQAAGQEKFNDLLYLLDQAEYRSSLYLINGAEFNRGLELRGKQPIDFENYDAAIYTAFLREYVDYQRSPETLAEFESFFDGCKAVIDGTAYRLAPVITDDQFTSDLAITYTFALIVDQPLFEQLAGSDTDAYTNILFPEDRLEKEGRIPLTEEAMQIYDKFTARYGTEMPDGEGGMMTVPPFNLWHKLQVMAREMIIIVAICYTFIYLGVIFTIMAVSILALQQLTEIRDRGKQYILLSRLGARESEIKKSVALQTTLYFGAPLIIALIHTIVGTMILHRMMQNSVPLDKWRETLLATMGIMIVLYLLYYAYTVISSMKYLNRVKLTERRESD